MADKRHSERFVKICEEARARVRETSAAEVKQRLEKGEPFFLVDVREESEWKEGRLTSSIHLGKGIIERDIEARIPDTDADIVLYCGGGYRSALAADNLQKMGYTRVRSMQGGYREWTTAGYPLEKKLPPSA